MAEIFAILIMFYIFIRIIKFFIFITKKIYYKIKTNNNYNNNNIYYRNSHSIYDDKNYNSYNNNNYFNTNPHLHNKYKRYNNQIKYKSYNNLSPEKKGELGESVLIDYLNQDISYYKKVLRNIYIPLKNGNMTEIDVLLICNYGIYVFEVKNYDGWIFGDRNQNTWTKTFPNGKRYKFDNPINQNLYHLKELENLLNIKKYNLYKSIVFFIGDAEIKSYIPNIDSNYILTKNDYPILNHIIKENNIELLTNYEIDEIYEKVKFCTNVDEITKLNHKNRINYNKFKNSSYYKSNN